MAAGAPLLPWDVPAEPVGSRIRRRRLRFQGRPPVARQSSYEAAVAAERTTPSMRCELVAYYQRRGLDGATDAEVERDLGWPPNIVTARRNDLVDDALVVAKLARRRTVKLDRRGKPKALRIVVWLLVAAITNGPS